MRRQMRRMATGLLVCLFCCCTALALAVPGLFLTGCSLTVEGPIMGEENLDQLWNIKGQVLSINEGGSSFELQSDSLVEDLDMVSDVATVNYDGASELVPGEEVVVKCFKNSIEPGMISRVESVETTEDPEATAKPGTTYDVTGEVTGINLANSTFVLKSSQFTEDLGLKSDEVTVSFGHLPDFKIGDKAEIAFTPEEMEFEDGAYTVSPETVEKL